MKNENKPAFGRYFVKKEKFLVLLRSLVSVYKTEKLDLQTKSLVISSILEFYTIVVKSHPVEVDKIFSGVVWVEMGVAVGGGEQDWRFVDEPEPDLGSNSRKQYAGAIYYDRPQIICEQGSRASPVVFEDQSHAPVNFSVVEPSEVQGISEISNQRPASDETPRDGVISGPQRFEIGLATILNYL
jgi:hypothetical protein